MSTERTIIKWTEPELVKIFWLVKTGYGGEQVGKNFMLLFPERTKLSLNYMVNEFAKVVDKKRASTGRMQLSPKGTVHKMMVKIAKRECTTLFPEELEIIKPEYSGITPKYEVMDRATILTYLGVKPKVDKEAIANNNKNLTPIKEYLDEHPDVKNRVLGIKEEVVVDEPKISKITNSIQAFTGSILDTNRIEMIHNILMTNLNSGEETNISISSKNMSINFIINRKEGHLG